MSQGTASKPPTENLPVRFDAVTVRYGVDARPALDHFSLEVRAGERVALIGPSGAGKSTVLSLAAGLVLPTDGSVTVHGVDSKDLGRRRHRDTRRRIGTIRQNFALVGPLRVAHNVAAGRLGSTGTLAGLKTLIRPRDVDGLLRELERVGIGDKLWERADQLSGGQQQRTAIARALYQDPPLILADEPLSALDPARSETVLGLLMRPEPSRTVIVSLHDAPLALTNSDRIIGLRHGSILFDSAPDDVTEDMLADLYLLDDDHLLSEATDRHRSP